MAIYVDAIPQNVEPIKILTIKDLVNVLPETLDYKFNVWIEGKLARFGKTTENLIFIIDSKEYPSSEIMMYFHSFVEPLGFQATASNNWKVSKNASLKLYNEGKLIIDKETMTYKELPSIIKENYYLNYQDVLNNMPKEIEWKQTIYLTGGIVKNGFSNNDVDFIIFDEINTDQLFNIRSLFNKYLNCKVDVGRQVMIEREPVYLYKIYENGMICQ